MGTCHNSILVNAPIDKVWATIRDFHDIMSWAPELITSCEVVGDAKGDQLGAKRVLNGAFHETLLGLNDLEYTIQYRIDDGPGPVAKDAVSDYHGTLQLFPATLDNATLAQWTSRYDSADSNAVGELCNPFYAAALQALKKHCEA